mmetsp:Transcript_215/g.476  ORF Transcript_215/g.476 Transcript_215/m.476 type:complete len:221 (-) Transcript_215:532-1194(-)
MLDVGEELGQDPLAISAGRWTDEDADGEATEEGWVAVLGTVRCRNNDDADPRFALATFRLQRLQLLLRFRFVKSIGCRWKGRNRARTLIIRLSPVAWVVGVTIRVRLLVNSGICRRIICILVAVVVIIIIIGRAIEVARQLHEQLGQQPAATAATIATPSCRHTSASATTTIGSTKPPTITGSHTTSSSTNGINLIKEQNRTATVGSSCLGPGPVEEIAY